MVANPSYLLPVTCFPGRAVSEYGMLPVLKSLGDANVLPMFYIVSPPQKRTPFYF